MVDLIGLDGGVNLVEVFDTAFLFPGGEAGRRRRAIGLGCGRETRRRKPQGAQQQGRPASREPPSHTPKLRSIIIVTGCGVTQSITTCRVGWCQARNTQKDPNSKLQKNSKFQGPNIRKTPSQKLQTNRYAVVLAFDVLARTSLEFDVWCFPEVWCLEFGVFKFRGIRFTRLIRLVELKAETV